MYGHVITKFSRMGRLPHLLSYGALCLKLRYEGNPGKSTLARVRARFELAKVRAIENQL